MQISMRMSGFSAGESDKVRKAVAKKKIKLMQEVVQHWDDGSNETMVDHWMNGAVRNDFKESTAKHIWDDVLKFASYAFNKSHSAGYAILVMQTAWIKAHYPREYMAAVLTSYMGKTEKIVHYVSACRHEGIDILPPDINESGKDFTAVPEGIRFGFAGIRGVGEGVADVIIAERAQGGPFKNIVDFVERVDGTQANRRVIEALIKSGAFDSTGYTRMQLMRLVDKANPENVIDAAATRQADRASGQESLFDLFGDDEDSVFSESVPEPDGVEWDRLTKLAQERDVLGIYVSDHPLSPYTYALAKASDYECADLDATDEESASGASKIKDGATVWLAGMVSAVQKKSTKNGDAMAIVTLEDLSGEATVVVFPRTFKECASILAGEVDEMGEQTSEAFVRIQGRLDRGDRGSQIIASKVEALELSEKTNRPKVLELLMGNSCLNRHFMESLSGILVRYPGLDQVEIRVEEASGDTMRLEIPCKVDAKNMLMFAELTDLLGEEGRAVVA